jgi:hypothetical protein
VYSPNQEPLPDDAIPTPQPEDLIAEPKLAASSRRHAGPRIRYRVEPMLRSAITANSPVAA